MNTLLDVIKADTQHFIPLGNVPVVGETTTISTALRFMHEHRTHGVLVRNKANRYRMLLHDQIIGQAATGLDVVKDPVKILVKNMPLLKTIDATNKYQFDSSLYVGNSKFKAVGVSMQGNLIGVMSLKETYKVYFVSASAGYYRCSDVPAHYYAFMPVSSVCDVDGTTVSPV